MNNEINTKTTEANEAAAAKKTDENIVLVLLQAIIIGLFS